MGCRCHTFCMTKPVDTCAPPVSSAPFRRGNGQRRVDPRLVADLPLFEGLSQAVIADLLGDAVIMERPRQSLLFSAGAAADCFYIVLSGTVKLFAVTEDGKESIVEIFSPVSSFAEAAMFASGCFPLSAEVIEEAALVRVGAGAFMRRLNDDHTVGFRMLAALARWNRRLSGEIWHLKEKNPEQRVAEFLLSLTSHTAGNVEVALPFRKGLVASRVGIGRESFSRVLARLRRIGVETDGNMVRINDVAALRRLCEPDSGGA